MKKPLLFSCLTLASCFLWTSYAWTYPVQEVSWNFCWETGGVCSIELPKIENADYLSYQNSALYREIYTVMWWGTYYDWRDFWFWSHQGVDIASELWTPIYSMWDWEIIEAWERGEWWNVVIIKHTVWNASLWSIYAHLDEVLVKVWDTVKEWALIAKMGNSWNTTWVHVHFQIDTTEGKHPYFPSWCEWTITEIVNEWRCWSQIKSNTLDPILFLETNGAIFLAEHKDETVSTISDSYLSASELNYSLGTTVLKQGVSTNLSILLKTSLTEGAFLKDDLSIETTTWLDTSANKIAYLWTGRDIRVVGNQAWLHKLTIKSWTSTLKRYTLFVLSDAMITKLREKFADNKKIQDILDSL